MYDWVIVFPFFLHLVDDTIWMWFVLGTPAVNPNLQQDITAHARRRAREKVAMQQGSRMASGSQGAKDHKAARISVFVITFTLRKMARGIIG